MKTWTIVALPRKEDLVWELSSEKIPHLTLLYLGEQGPPATAIRIIEHLRHTINTSLTPFGLDVDRRGLLGADYADVLFFEDSNMKKLHEFRSHLLKNDDIFTAYSSTFQYPKWNPHLTLGHPKTPAKKSKYGASEPRWVSFDRIAFWVDDYDGPEFDIPTPIRIESEMTMAADTDDFLIHYGVKGMKWGVRRSQAQLDRASGRKSKRSKPTESRKEYRSRLKQEKSDFYQKKAKNLADVAAKKGNDVLISSLFVGDTGPTIRTGNEFVKELTKGRAMNVQVTDIFAESTGDGPYQMVNPSERYKKSARR